MMDQKVLQGQQKKQIMISRQQKQSQTLQQHELGMNFYIPKSSNNITSSMKQKYQSQHYFNRFALYCSRRGKHSNQTTSSSYNENLHPVSIIQNLDDFFEYYLALKKPSELLIDSKIMLFYENCKPFWQQWINSGCLLIKFRNKPEQQTVLDVIWEYLNYSFVGGNLDDGIIGICLCKRDKITLVEIWLRKNDRAKDIGYSLEQQISRQLPPSLGLSLNKLLKVKHKKHSDSINTNSTIKGAQNLTQFNLKRSQLNNSF